jgi:hypothetical protein
MIHRESVTITIFRKGEYSVMVDIDEEGIKISTCGACAAPNGDIKLPVHVWRQVVKHVSTWLGDK